MRGGWHRSGPPPWWPDNEAWPPRRGARRARGPFLFRLGGFLFFALMIGAFGLARLVTVAAEQAGITLPRPLVAFAVVALIFAFVPVLFWSGMRRIGLPLGDIVDAAERVGRGDYSVRLIERGPPFLRTVGRAFNAMAARLATHEAERRHLMADVAHELRTPLAIMRGRLEGLIDGVYARDDATLGQLVDETKRLERLVDDLRTLAHAEGGTLKLQREPTDLVVLVTDVVGTLQTAARSRDVTLAVDAPADLPLIDVDPLRIREVIVNLVTNALRYAPPRTRVAIAVRAAAGAIAVAVEDSGPGFAADELPRVFDRFAKGADSLGSGLGLTIARNLVEAHGGTIAAANRPDGGAALTFTLPMAVNPDHSTARA
jgi:signal transduction histidine kinase